MKKWVVLLTIMLMCLTGCGKFTVTDAIEDFESKVKNSKSYKISGTMEINSSEETFVYSIETNFLKDDYYKVVLINQTNNHEQVILKNLDGLFVVTPSLNKSFKFDSIWPENSSQAYLLGNLVNDIKNDPKVELEESDNNYILKNTVNYPNNEELKYQKIYFDKKMNIEKVEVYNEEDIVKIKVNFKNINMKAKLTEDDFVIDDLIDENISNDNKIEEKCEGSNCEEKSTSTLDSIIYPLYIPANTYLSDSETVATETSERIILTFSGDKNFVIVEEVAKPSKEFEIVPVYGDPLMLYETIGALSSNSLSWHSNDVAYYLVSSDLSTKEMVEVASSLGNATTVSSLK
ncbi:MAG: outer membrane lipoprotein carrier protein LolA [Firmicutes bacterium]|nr:outer membrane lipoprotein carrier protein LolA [Bacillota bacterium]